jgi:predicted SnoaL-like aldol condensation-catalyzing enzyme
MDFWRVAEGRIAENWVSVDFALVLRQLGRDPFDGQGWD